jgi:hypothetical protein
MNDARERGIIQISITKMSSATSCPTRPRPPATPGSSRGRGMLKTFTLKSRAPTTAPTLEGLPTTTAFLVRPPSVLTKTTGPSFSHRIRGTSAKRVRNTYIYLENILTTVGTRLIHGDIVSAAACPALPAAPPGMQAKRHHIEGNKLMVLEQTYLMFISVPFVVSVFLGNKEPWTFFISSNLSSNGWGDNAKYMKNNHYFNPTLHQKEYSYQYADKTKHQKKWIQVSVTKQKFLCPSFDTIPDRRVNSCVSKNNKFQVNLKETEEIAEVIITIFRWPWYLVLLRSIAYIKMCNELDWESAFFYQVSRSSSHAETYFLG